MRKGAFLGYIGTMGGVPGIDYHFVDQYSVLPGEEKYYHETLKYLEESDLSVEDIHNTFNKLYDLKNAIIKVQHLVNDAKRITDIDDIKMEIFKLWYLASFEREYGKEE